MTLTADTITNAAIAALRTEAAQVGDADMTEVCSRALGALMPVTVPAGRMSVCEARAACADVINARAMENK